LRKGRLYAGLFVCAGLCLSRHCHLLPLKPQSQQTVDGLHEALEIAARSSYVPSSPNWRLIPAFPAMRA
jgi:hypothetical protein